MSDLSLLWESENERRRSSWKMSNILGVSFFKGTVEEACKKAQSGGLVVAPSGPGMANDLPRCEIYAQALLNADLTLMDSGLIGLWSKFFKREKYTRISGLAFLREYLNSGYWTGENSLWVMPDKAQAKANLTWLRNRYGIRISEEFVYVAPMYSRKGEIIDNRLLERIEELRPQNLFVQLGGGVQERLGLYLKNSLTQLPAILCTGAALAFLSGQQVSIPNWTDRFYLGWMFRCFDQPRVFFPRYMKSFRLVYLLFKYGERLPVK